MEQRTLLLATPDPGLFERIDRQLCGDVRIALLPHVRNETEALALVRDRHPDVALLDFGAFAETALVLVDRIAATHPQTRSLLFAAAWTEQAIVRALQGGSCGCVQIDGRRSELLDAIEAVSRGEIWVSRRTLATAFRQLLRTSTRGDPAALQRRLSKREREIVDWMRHGMSNKEIARKLGISDMTVKTHVHNIFHKLEISGRVRLLGMPSPPVHEPAEPTQTYADSVNRHPLTVLEPTTLRRG